jgi:hypothetical protein
MGLDSVQRRSRTVITAVTLTLGALTAAVVPGAQADSGSPSAAPLGSSSAPPASPPAALGSRLLLGAYVPDLPDGRADLPTLENSVGAHLAIAAAYVDWSYVIGGANELWMADNGTRLPLLAWEPSGVRFTDVTDGSEDGYLQQVATSMLAFPYTVYVRPWPEMNANWSTWQPTPGGNKPDGGTPAQFIAAWRYLVSFFRSRGVTNLKFVFDPDSSTYSDNTPISTIWPGTSYVDVLGMDGYNWGNDSVGDTWQSFDSVFAPMYGILTAIDPSVPVWICETASKEPEEEDDSLYPTESSPVDPSNSKGTWIDQMLNSTALPNIQAVVWFNKKKERDWPIGSSADSLSAFQNYFSNSANAARQWLSQSGGATYEGTFTSTGGLILSNPNPRTDGGRP